MIQMQISEQLYEKLENLRDPVLDTHETVIARLIGLYERLSTNQVDGRSSAQSLLGKRQDAAQSGVVHREYTGEDSVLQFCISDQGTPEPVRLPDVTHTTFKRGMAGDLPAEDWNQLLGRVHERLFQMLGSSMAELRRVSGANLQEGTVVERGFKPVVRDVFSIQGVEANKACALAFGLARRYKIPIWAEFKWQGKEKAAFPGRSGRIEWKPD